ETLIRVAESSKTALIADAYDSDLQMVGERALSGNSAAGLYNAFCLSTGAKWTFEDGWVSIRKKEWQTARAGTVPRELVFPSRDSFVSQSGLSIDQLADLATKVTDRQSRSIAM